MRTCWIIQRNVEAFVQIPTPLFGILHYFYPCLPDISCLIFNRMRDTLGRCIPPSWGRVSLNNWFVLHVWKWKGNKYINRRCFFLILSKYMFGFSKGIFKSQRIWSLFSNAIKKFPNIFSNLVFSSKYNPSR